MSTLLRRSVIASGLLLPLGACSVFVAPEPRLTADPVIPPDGYFLMGDGARLPYRAWRPDGEAWAVVLALHGFNDSRDAWEIPAPEFTAAGIAIYAPDQRGFGQAPERGRFVGVDRMARDAIAIAHRLRQAHPNAKLFLMGESMGGAVLMRAATMPYPPAADGYVLIAPAVWGRAEMGIILSSGLWLVSGVAPWWQVSAANAPVKVRASDNNDALKRLAHDPLTIHETRFDTIRGLVDAMDAAQAAAPRFRAPGLFMYGLKDELVPPEATAAMWKRLPSAARLAAYPNGYHLLLRDKARLAPIGDAVAWMRDPQSWLPSGADIWAATWMATRR